MGAVFTAFRRMIILHSQEISNRLLARGAEGRGLRAGWPPVPLCRGSQGAQGAARPQADRSEPSTV